MKENKYDDPEFYEQYSRMTRSTEGLSGAGEWHVLKKMLPDFSGKRVLDLGCGFGWHCRYAAEHGAVNVIGIDLSEKMLEKAKEINCLPVVEYKRSAIEDVDFPDQSFDIVISSLAFHYIESFDSVCRKVAALLTDGGSFVFSVEHPVFTAYGTQNWWIGEGGVRLHWPVDRYFEEGSRKAVFLGQNVIKYHRTLTSYLNVLLKNGFTIKAIAEPEPDPQFLVSVPEMRDELRRPMFLIVSSEKLKQ